MKKVALILTLLFFNLFACNAGFNACLQKTKDLDVIRDDKLFIPISNHKLLVFSSTPLKNYIKKDSFLNLYLLNSKKYYPYPFKINKYLKFKTLASIKDKIVCANIISKQNALDSFAKFSKKTATPAIILNGCCELVAIDTPKGIIEKKYINNFLYHNKKYADIGIRVKDINSNVVIKYVNPFLQTAFKPNDVLLLLDSKKIKNSYWFNSKILFSKIDSIHKIKIKRNNHIKTINAKIFKRKGGGFLSDTFLEYKGIYVDKNLKVIKSTNPKILKNDKIIMLNSKIVKTQNDIKKILSYAQDFIKLGIRRNGFDFFIKIDIR